MLEIIKALVLKNNLLEGSNFPLLDMLNIRNYLPPSFFKFVFYSNVDVTLET